MYGRLEEVARIAGRSVTDVRDATGRLVGYRSGEAIDIIDVENDFAVVGHHEDVGPFTMATRIACHGTRILIRRPDALELRDVDGTRATAATPTRRIKKTGKPATAKTKPFELADEHLGFIGDHVWLATHNAAGRACLQLYDLDLRLVDEFADLRSYSPYEIGEEPSVPVRMWTESRLATQRHHPSWVIGYANAGDSCCAVVAFRVEGGRLVVDQEQIARAIFDIDAYALRELTLMPSSALLMMSRDRLLSVLAWPQPGPVRIHEHSATKHLRNADHEIVLPFAEHAHLVEYRLHVTGREVLLQFDHDTGPAAFVALDPATLEPRGLVELPVNKGWIWHLGNDLFAQDDVVWRLVTDL